MKVIAVLTTLFLPGAFISVRSSLFLSPFVPSFPRLTPVTEHIRDAGPKLALHTSRAHHNIPFLDILGRDDSSDTPHTPSRGPLDLHPRFEERIVVESCKEFGQGGRNRRVCGFDVVFVTFG